MVFVSGGDIVKITQNANNDYKRRYGKLFLLALAKLFGVADEELLKEAQ